MRKVIMVILIFVLTAITSLVFADSEVKEGNAEENIEIYYVAIDGTVEINIEENMTTGFSWHWTVDNPTFIETKVDEHTEGNNDGVVGAAGIHTWIFETKNQGIVNLTFEYYRDWEPEVVAESKKIMLNIVPDGEKSIYINDFNTEYDSHQPELLGGVLEDSEVAETTVENLNIFQRIIRWFLNLFR
ncbi:MAG: protease inhibitor I42 family protein [Clostridiales bacterium]|nr:protease inhibitor I42 family protein [Clostridiales bacterium]